MAVLKVLTRVQKKKDAYTLGGTVSTAILESSMKVVPGEEVMGNLSEDAFISHP